MNAKKEMKQSNYSAYVGIAGSSYFSEHLPEEYFHAVDALFNTLQSPPSGLEVICFNGEGIINSNNLKELVKYIVKIRGRMSLNDYYIKVAICEESEPVDKQLLQKENFTGLKLNKGYKLRSFVKQGKLKGIGVNVDNILYDYTSHNMIFNENFYLDPNHPKRIIHFHDIPLSVKERGKSSLNNFLQSFSLSTYVSPKLSRFHISFLSNWVSSIDFKKSLNEGDQNFLTYIVKKDFFDKTFSNVTNKNLIYYILLNKIYENQEIHEDIYNNLYTLIKSKKMYINELQNLDDIRIISDAVKHRFLKDLSEQSINISTTKLEKETTS